MLTHKLTTDDGVDLIAVEAGNPSGAPIVFVTGLAQTWHTYSRLLTDSALAHYRLIAFNPRGHGASSGGLASMGADGLPVLLPDSLYSTDDPVETSALWSRDLEAVRGQLGLTNPTLVGWSYGGVIVLDHLSTQGGLDGVHAALIIATPSAAGPPGTPDIGADLVFTPTAIDRLLMTIPVHPVTGRANTPEEISAGLMAFAALLFDDQGPIAPSFDQMMLTTAMSLLTPPAVRGAIMGRAFDHRGFLANLNDASRARITVLLPQLDAELQVDNLHAQWVATGVTATRVPGEGHMFHQRNSAALSQLIAEVAG